MLVDHVEPGQSESLSQVAGVSYGMRFGAHRPRVLTIAARCSFPSSRSVKRSKPFSAQHRSKAPNLLNLGPMHRALSKKSLT